MNKASMILKICSLLDIKYLESMHNMSYIELEMLYNNILKISKDIEEIKNILTKHFQKGKN